jgi:hypothetical protein
VVDDDRTEPPPPPREPAEPEPILETPVPEPEPQVPVVEAAEVVEAADVEAAELGAADVEAAVAEPAEPTTVIHTISAQRSAPDETGSTEPATETFVFPAPPPDEAMREAEVVPEEPEAPAPAPAPAPAVVPQRRSVEGGARPRANPAPKPGKVRSGPPPKNPRRPWFALPALVLLALVATFFGWVSAEPLWLAVGHSQPGTATITHSDGGGLNNRCRGQFTAAGDAFTIPLVRVTGLPDDQCVTGTSVPARAVSDSAREAYAGETTGLHLRWGIGLGLVLLCGLLIAWLTGAGRFAGWRRVLAVGLSVAAPVLVAVGLIVAAY